MKKLFMALMMVGLFASVDADAGLVHGNECPSKGNSYFYNGKCHQCPKNHQWDEKNEKCVNSSGASASKCPLHATCPKGVDGFLCDVGYYKKSKNAKVCTKCPKNAHTCQANQIYCKPGDYLTDKKTCAKCPAGFECIGYLLPARPCEAGTYAPAGSKRCLPCPDNTYTPEEKAAKCTPCPKNAKCYLNRFKCNEGYYKNSDKAKSCKECSAGYMCNGTSRFKCPAGTYASAGSFVCTSCSGDTYSSAGASKCKSCPKGQKPNEKHTACVKA